MSETKVYNFEELSNYIKKLDEINDITSDDLSELKKRLLFTETKNKDNAKFLFQLNDKCLFFLEILNKLKLLLNVS